MVNGWETPPIDSMPGSGFGRLQDAIVVGHSRRGIGESGGAEIDPERRRARLDRLPCDTDRSVANCVTSVTDVITTAEQSAISSPTSGGTPRPRPQIVFCVAEPSRDHGVSRRVIA